MGEREPLEPGAEPPAAAHGRHAHAAPRSAVLPRLGSGAARWAALGAVLVATSVILAILFGNPPRDVTPTAQADAPTTGEDGERGAGPGDPTPSTRSTPSVPGTTEGDLGLAVPMASPECDGRWAVFVGAAIDPTTVEEDVTTFLDRHPGARYTLTEGACSSLRQRTPGGDRIYAVYLAPYPDQAAACAVRTELGGDAYVKRMDDSTPPEQTWEC